MSDKENRRRRSNQSSHVTFDTKSQKDEVNKGEGVDDTSRDKRENRRKKIKKEIFHTEETYQKHLELIVKHFEEPLEDSKLIPGHIIVAIFGNIRQIIKLNKELLHHLQTQPIGAAFLEIAPFLKLYSMYANNHERALATLMEWDQKSPEFAQFRRKQEEVPEMSGLKLNALLITPVQRIPRYKLLLEDLLLYTCKDHSDYLSIQEASKSINEVATHINEHIKQQDNFMKMLAIQKSLTGPVAPRILAPGRMFIKEGPLKKVTSKGRSCVRMFYLFSDILIYAKPKIMESGSHSYSCCCIFPLQHCQVTRVFGQSKGQGALFTITCKTESLLLYSDQKTVNTWMTVLSKSISQLVTNRQSLRKESSAKTPIRKGALVKLKKQQDMDDPLQAAMRKTPKKTPTTSPATSTHSESPLRQVLREAKTLDCLSPLRKRNSPSIMKCLTPRSRRSKKRKQKQNEDDEPDNQLDKAPSLHNISHDVIDLDSHPVKPTPKPRKSTQSNERKSIQSNEIKINIIQPNDEPETRLPAESSHSRTSVLRNSVRDAQSRTGVSQDCISIEDPRCSTYILKDRIPSDSVDSRLQIPIDDSGSISSGRNSIESGFCDEDFVGSRDYFQGDGQTNPFPGDGAPIAFPSNEQVIPVNSIDQPFVNETLDDTEAFNNEITKYLRNVNDGESDSLNIYAPHYTYSGNRTSVIESAIRGSIIEESTSFDYNNQSNNNSSFLGNAQHRQSKYAIPFVTAFNMPSMFNDSFPGSDDNQSVDSDTETTVKRRNQSADIDCRRKRLSVETGGDLNRRRPLSAIVENSPIVEEHNPGVPKRKKSGASLTSDELKQLAGELEECSNKTKDKKDFVNLKQSVNVDNALNIASDVGKAMLPTNSNYPATVCSVQ